MSAQPEAGPYGPPQVTPVKRPFRVQPHETVDLSDDDELVSLRLHLIHSANYNDPAVYPAVAFTRRWR